MVSEGDSFSGQSLGWDAGTNLKKRDGQEEFLNSSNATTDLNTELNSPDANETPLNFEDFIKPKNDVEPGNTAPPKEFGKGAIEESKNDSFGVLPAGNLKDIKGSDLDYRNEIPSVSPASFKLEKASEIQNQSYPDFSKTAIPPKLRSLENPIFPEEGAFRELERLSNQLKETNEVGEKIEIAIKMLEHVSEILKILSELLRSEGTKESLGKYGDTGGGAPSQSPSVANSGEIDVSFKKEVSEPSSNISEDTNITQNNKAIPKETAPDIIGE